MYISHQITAKQTNSNTTKTIILIITAIISSITKPISIIKETASVNNIPTIEKQISIRKEAFNSFKRIFPSLFLLMKSIVFERKKEIHIAKAAISIDIKAGSKAIMASHTLDNISGIVSISCRHVKIVKAIVRINGIMESLQNCLNVYALNAAFQDNSKLKSAILRQFEP